MMLRRLFISVPAVLIAGLLGRLAGLAFIDFSVFNWAKPQPDLLMEYGVIARNLAKGLGYSYTWHNSHGMAVTLPSAYMPPGQVFLDYGMIALFGYSTAAVIGIFLLHVLMGVACVWLVGEITHELFERKNITAAARWIMALYPPFLYAAASFGITATVIFINCLILLAAIKFVRSIGEGKAAIGTVFALGVSWGAIMLWRGEGPLIVLASVGVIGYLLRKRLGHAFPPLVLASILALLMLAPWTIRNYIVFDRFIPVSSNGSFNFWRGNNPLSTGSPFIETGEPLWSTEELWSAAESHLDEGANFENAYSALYRHAAFEWITEHPMDWMSLALKKALIFWTFDTRSKAGGLPYYLMHSVALAATIFGSVRLMKLRKRLPLSSRTGLWLIGTWMVLATIVAMVFLPLQRFQIIVMALAVPLGAYGITDWFERKAIDRS